jgi:prolyl-tRNA synthetase
MRKFYTKEFKKKKKKKIKIKNTGDNCQQQPGELKINKIRETKFIVSILSKRSSEGRKTLLRI